MAGFKEKKFSDTRFMDLRGQTYPSQIDVEKNELTSLEGAPDRVLKGFFCAKNKLTDLKGSPQFVDGEFSCYSNKLESLEGGPKEVKGIFFCDKNKTLKNPREQIIKNQIKAVNYYTDEGIFDFNSIKKEFEDYAMKYRVNSKGFRTLLGLDK